MVSTGRSSCTQRVKAPEHDQQKSDQNAIAVIFPAPPQPQSISLRIIRSLPLQPPPQALLIALRHATVLPFHFSCHQGDRGVRRGHSETTVSIVVVLLLLRRARPGDRTRLSRFHRRLQTDTVNTVARRHVWTGFVTVHTQIVVCGATARSSSAAAAAARPNRDQSRAPC